MEKSLMELVERSDLMLRFGVFFQTANARLRVQEKVQANLDARMSLSL